MDVSAEVLQYHAVNTEMTNVKSIKEIEMEVTKMKKSKSSSRSVVIMMALFGVMVVMSPRRADGQQDVDPTWYDPWTPATPVVAHVVSHANATQTTAKANEGQKALPAATRQSAKAKLTSGSTQKTAKLHKIAQSKQS